MNYNPIFPNHALRSKGVNVLEEDKKKREVWRVTIKYLHDMLMQNGLSLEHHPKHSLRRIYRGFTIIINSPNMMLTVVKISIERWEE